MGYGVTSRSTPGRLNAMSVKVLPTRPTVAETIRSVDS